MNPPGKVLTALKSIYPVLFTLAFGCALVAPILKKDVSVANLRNNFLGNNRLIQIFNTLRLKLGDHVFPNALVGEDGWMYYTGQGSVDDFQASHPFSDDELAAYQKSFDTLTEQLQQKNILLLLVIAPDKSTIYPQYMPVELNKVGDRSRLDQFIEFNRLHGKTPILDLRSSLIKASDTEDVYYKTNSHWNSSAEYIVYENIMNSLSASYPQLSPRPLTDFIPSAGVSIIHDIPRIIGVPNMREKYWNLTPTFESRIIVKQLPLPDGTLVRYSTNIEPGLPIALIYHDSFLDGIVQFLEPHFSEAVSVPSTAIPGIWNLKWIDLVHPDIIIIEFAERFMNMDNYGELLH